MKVIIAGGGTGGHIFPALALAEEFLGSNDNDKVLFIGTMRGMEKKLIYDKGYEMDYIRSAPIMGKGILNKIKAVIVSFIGVFDSLRIINRFRPDVVIGVGGYVSGPVIISSYILGLPRVICEQNSIPGFTNRVLSHFAQKIFISFESSRKYFPENKMVLSGNPIQKKIANTTRKKDMDADYTCILVLGGSQGASKLNQILPDTIRDLVSAGLSRIKVIHQTGERDFNEVSKIYEKYNIDAEIYDFFHEMEKLYKRADLVIARAGAGTVAELCAVGVPSILIPFPFATHNHQFYNAKVLEDTGGAILIEEKDLTVDNLGAVIKSVISGRMLEDMSERARNAGRPNAAKVIVENIRALVKDKNV